MSVDFTPKELQREDDAELQRRMNIYKPESGAYKAAEAEWNRRRNAGRERVELAIKVILVVLAIPAAVWAAYQLGSALGWF